MSENSEAMQWMVWGVIESCSIKMIGGVKVKSLRLQGDDEEYILDSVFQDEFDLCGVGTSVTITVVLEEDEESEDAYVWIDKIVLNDA